MYDQQKKELLMELSTEIKYETVHVDFLSERDVEILTIIGIPDSLSPFIDIVPEKKYGGYTLYDRVNIYEKYPLDKPEFKNLCLFGKNGGGYLVINREGKVAIFDTEVMELLCVNKSLDTFLDSAYEYAQFVKSVIKKNGEDAYLDGNYSEDDVDMLRKALISIDETSVEEGFWADKLADLIDNIE